MLIDILENPKIGHSNNRKEIKEFIKHHALPITHPYNNIDKAHELFLFENYLEAEKSIADKLKIKLKIPKLNVSINKDQFNVSKLTGNQINRLEKIYKQDIILYKNLK